jgi:hypothetical protein
LTAEPTHAGSANFAFAEFAGKPISAFSKSCQPRL